MRLVTAHKAYIPFAAIVFTTLLFVPTLVSANSKQSFKKIYSDLEKLRKNEHTDRKAWLRVIDSFAKVHGGPTSNFNQGRAIFLAGKASLELYRRTKNKADLKQALTFLREFNRIRCPSGKALYDAPVPKRLASTTPKRRNRNTWNAACTSAGSLPLPKDRSLIVDRSQVGNHSQFVGGCNRSILPKELSTMRAPNPFWSPSMSESGWGHVLLPQRKNARTLDREISTPKHFSPLRTQPTKKKFVVVIDPGHGGRDPGAISPDGKVTEKELTLRMAKILRKRLEVIHPGISVFLTRTDDKYLSLEERTSMANSLKADLFISIHCNSAEDNSYKGIETYYLSPASSGKSLEVAARENGISLEMMGDVEATLLDMIMTSKSSESVKLARTVHANLIRSVSANIEQGDDRHIKEAPFYVLLGAKMPAILIECGFISNSEDRKRLLSAKFVHEFASGIAVGTDTYLKTYGDKISCSFNGPLPQQALTRSN